MGFLAVRFGGGHNCPREFLIEGLVEVVEPVTVARDSLSLSLNCAHRKEGATGRSDAKALFLSKAALGCMEF